MINDNSAVINTKTLNLLVHVSSTIIVCTVFQ